jgi:hypothetical protein
MLVVAWGIAYLTRRRPIGSWLFYFYFQLYLSFLFSFIFLPGVISNINPSGWDNSQRYSMFVASTVPVIAAQWFEVFAATRLLIRRNAQNLWTLRLLLFILIVLSAASTAIDLAYFQTNAVFDIMTLVFAIIWSLYFYKSVRVKQVFVDHTFSHPDAAPKRSPAEWRYVGKRAVIVGVITFFVMLPIIGSNRGETKPDVHMFVLALIDAAVFAAFSLLFPIRKKKVLALRSG